MGWFKIKARKNLEPQNYMYLSTPGSASKNKTQKETSIVSAVFSFLNIFVLTNWKTFTSYVLTILKVAVLINSEYNRIATRQFSKGAKVTLHTVVLTC